MIIKNIKDYVLYDSETTGLYANECRIIEHGCIRVRDNKIVEELRVLVKGIPIPDDAFRIHGISASMCEKDGYDAKTACQKTMSFMGSDIVIGLNNVAFDFAFLEVECNRHGFPRPKIENWFDVGTWYKGLCIGNLYNEKELFYRYSNRIRDLRVKNVKFNLNHLVKTFEVENLRDDGLHGAIKDLYMTFHVFNKMKEKYCV